MLFDYSNIFVNSLDSQDKNRIDSESLQVDLPVGTVLYETGAAPEYAYFLTSGFASQVIAMDSTEGVEVGIVGSEGVVGSLFLLGPALPSHNCFMQSDGAGFRIRFQALRKMFLESEDLRDKILAHVQVQTVTATCLAACNKVHHAEARLARWLLMVQDHLQTDRLPLKQEFLAQMLGTGSKSADVAVNSLNEKGLISYGREVIRVFNRELLEMTTCECYKTIRTVYSYLSPQPLSSVST